MKISPNDNAAIFEIINQAPSKILVFNGTDGKIIFNQPAYYRSRILSFNDNDLIIYYGMGIAHYSISNNILSGKKFPSQLLFPTLPSSDSTGKYFGAIDRDLTEKEKYKYLFLLFKKESDSFILYKKITLSDYDLFKKEPTAYSPTLIYKTYIDENGIVSLFCQDNKLLKFK
jgi:hypothetical protein